MLRFSCPKCARGLSAPEDCAGRSSKCRWCCVDVVVPTRTNDAENRGQKISAVQDLVSYYQQELQFTSFYTIITSRLARLSAQEGEFTRQHRFLSGIPRAESACDLPLVLPLPPYTRIDVPVWFGSPIDSKFKILVFGLEPRNSNEKFNIEATANRVFAAPFGADRWNPKTTVPRKGHMKYYRVFERLITYPKVSIVFSDIVKTYEVSGHGKKVDDDHARDSFNERAGSPGNLRILRTEIELVAPHRILCLGKPAFRFMRKHPELSKGSRLDGIRHPSQGGESEAKRQIEQIALEIPH